MDIATIGAAMALVKNIPGSAAGRAEAAAAAAAATAESISDSMEVITLLTTTGNLFDQENTTWTDQNLATQNDDQGRDPGTIFDSTTFKLSGAIPVDEAEPVLHLWRTAYDSGNHYVRVGFYDSSDQPLNGWQAWGATSSGGEKTAAIPAGTKTIRIAMSKNDIENQVTVAYQTLTGHVAYEQKAKTSIRDTAVGETLSTRVAAKAYVPGDYVVLDGVLYMVTANVASGGTLAEGTNIRATTIADELSGPVSIDVTGSDPVITARKGVRYVCGTIDSLTFTPSDSGICEVVFTSGSTQTVLDTTTLTDVSFPEWFDPTSLEPDMIYDIMISDGTLGMVMTWLT